MKEQLKSTSCSRSLWKSQSRTNLRTVQENIMFMKSHWKNQEHI